jgi:hypothetical protein
MCPFLMEFQAEHRDIEFLFGPRCAIESAGCSQDEEIWVAEVCEDHGLYLGGKEGQGSYSGLSYRLESMTLSLSR